MRELGFAIAGAAALIVLGLWALGHSESQEWSDEPPSMQPPMSEISRPASTQAAGGAIPESVRLTHQGPAQR